MNWTANDWWSRPQKTREKGEKRENTFSKWVYNTGGREFTKADTKSLPGGEI